MKNLVRGAAIAVVATTVGLALTGTASAEGTPAPSCVFAKESTDGWGGRQTVRVENQCTYRVRVQAQTTFASDSSCNTLWPRQEFRHSYHRGGNFVGVVNC